MKNEVQLIAYVDRFCGGSLQDLNGLLNGPLAGVFGGVHLLPFFNTIDGADTGFDPIDHSCVDSRLGSWTDIKAIASHTDLMVDLIVNHMSSESTQFRDFIEKGDKSAYAELFVTYDQVFPEGANEHEILAIYRPRPKLPFTVTTFRDRSKRMLWTTFTPRQIDIDVESAAGRAYLTRTMKTFAENGIKILRLDAVGYAIKRAGANCFMMPETFTFIDSLTDEAKSLGMEVLVEVHAYFKTQIEIAAHVERVYNFALPPLVLHTLFSNNTAAIKNWLSICPRNAITVLDTHDGIGVIDIGPDATNTSLPGLIGLDDIDQLVETIHKNSGGISRHATGEGKSNLDIYQVNCSYYDALGKNDQDYLLARLIQFFTPGVPQLYYMGLLAGENATEQFEQTGSGRELNRRRYTLDEVLEDLQKPVVQTLLGLIYFRNIQPAFNGEFTLLDSADNVLHIRWKLDELEEHRAELKLDVQARTFNLIYTEKGQLKALSDFADLAKQPVIRVS